MFVDELRKEFFCRDNMENLPPIQPTHYFNMRDVQHYQASIWTTSHRTQQQIYLQPHHGDRIGMRVVEAGVPFGSLN